MELKETILQPQEEKAAEVSSKDGVADPSMLAQVK